MDEREDGVLALLRERYGHVSTERVCSGPGLVNIYESLCALDHVVVKALKPEQVAEAGLNGSDPQCAEALQMFCAILGTAAANLVITLGARGGLYIGGGIVPRLGRLLRRFAVPRAFRAQGAILQVSGRSAGVGHPGGESSVTGSRGGAERRVRRDLRRSCTIPVLGKWLVPVTRRSKIARPSVSSSSSLPEQPS
jgi:hypothetical protein